MKAANVVSILAILALLAAGVSCHAQGLLEYVEKPDPTFKWEMASKQDSLAGPVYKLRMTSQKWQGIEWTHDIELLKPSKCDYPKTAILIVTGGGPGNKWSMAASMLAASARCPVAILYQIPNQPLFDNLHEDGLIAHTFVKAIETGDYTWPLLLPMAKCAVRAMDAVQAFASTQLKSPIDGFVVAGASKRGWTTWLTGAADPARVKGIVPMVYDNLNLTAQMAHQIRCYGNYSEKIDDYTVRNVQEKLQTEAGQKLARVVDPWSYRSRITMPKMIMNGTNDPYWTVDSLNIYWNDISGPKYVNYVPNAGHNLDSGDIGGAARSVLTCAAFARAIAAGSTLPKVTWEITQEKGACRILVSSDPQVTQAKLWTASSDTLDFRKSKWVSSSMESSKTGYTAKAEYPTKGYSAAFAEVSVPVDDGEWTVCTQIEVLDGKGPAGAQR